MAKEPAIEIDGEITETLPNAMFKQARKMVIKYWLIYLVK